MSKQFAVMLKNDDLSEIDIYMAIEDYLDTLYTDGEIDEVLEFEVHSMD